MIAQRLAHLAVSRARLQHGISTAADSGDTQWCRDNRPILDELDSRIDALVKVLDPKIIQEAREITNAPI